MSDKRSVATDALETLGTAPIPEGSGRDAIHLAVEPVIAAEELRAGMDVGFVEGGVGSCQNPVGIVDPFVVGKIRKGDLFWLVVYPRTITSLRHVWSHPAFEEASKSEVSEVDKDKARHIAERLTNSGERWLREFCLNPANDCPGDDDLMEAIKNGGSMQSKDGEYGITINDEHVFVGGRDAHGSIPPEFWNHVEAVTGKKQELRPTYFSYSC